MSTGIQWTDETWNPTTGCDKVSPGCDHCYALTMAKRLKGMGSKDYQNDGNPATSGPGFAATMHPHRLDQPLRWKRPRRIFVNSMSDLFHEAIGDEFIARVFAVMALAPQHTFQVLTKRHGRMRSLVSSIRFDVDVTRYAQEVAAARGIQMRVRRPLPNVWLGVSVEDQKWATIRGKALRETPAAVRFYSAEPLLAEIPDLPLKGIHWVIVGGESGPNARPMHPDWARSIRDQCIEADVPLHFKQWGEWLPDDDMPADHPEHVVSVTPAVPQTPTAPWRPPLITMHRVGKHAAGRELDGRTWDEWPETA